MPALTGNFTLAGFAATTRVQRKLVVPDRIPYVLTGQSVTLTPGAAVRFSTVPTITFNDGAGNDARDLTQYVTGWNASQHVMSLSGSSASLPTGVTLSSGGLLSFNDATGGVASVSGLQVEVNSSSAGDWLTRISGPGVVWYHNFDAAAEVNNFRWTGAFGSGNDPLGVGAGLVSPPSSFPATVAHVASGGADGGGFMRLTRPQNCDKDDIYWYRQFSPLTAGSNGRPTADPAASGTIALRSYTPTSRGQETAFWSMTNPAGWYGKPGYEVAGLGPGTADAPPQLASAFDGNEFYLQLRVRQRLDRMTTGNVINGKFTNLTMTTNSHTNQELVTVSAWPTPSSPVGGPYQPNLHNMYEGAFTGMIGDGSNATFGIRNSTGPQWAYSGGWDTLLYHIVPGTHDTNRAAAPQIFPFTYDTLIEVWAAHQGVTTYTKIWEAHFSAIFDNTSSFDPYTHNKWAWNALICWVYQNGEQNATAIVQDFDQIIFSKNTIPCPQV